MPIDNKSRSDSVNAAIASIERQFGKGTIVKTNLETHMYGQMGRTDDMAQIQDIADAYDMMIELAPSLSNETYNERRLETSEYAQTVRKIVLKSGLSDNFVKFHLSRAVQDAQSGELLSLARGADLVAKRVKEVDAHKLRRQQWIEQNTVIVGNRRIEIKSPVGMGKGRPTYGHTRIGKDFAPEGMSDEEAVKYLSNRFRGAPMWEFGIYKDPESGRFFAYYEIDTSG